MRGGASQRTAGAVLILVGLLLTGLSSCVLDTPYDKYAIVYGVSIYDPGNPENDGLGPNLVYPNDDAVAMEAMLLGQGYEVLAKTDENATLAKLLA